MNAPLQSSAIRYLPDNYKVIPNGSLFDIYISRGSEINFHVSLRAEELASFFTNTHKELMISYEKRQHEETLRREQEKYKAKPKAPKKTSADLALDLNLNLDINIELEL